MFWFGYQTKLKWTKLHKTFAITTLGHLLIWVGPGVYNVWITFGCSILHQWTYIHMYCTCIPVLLMEAISQHLSLFSSKGKAPTAHGVRRGLRCSLHDRLYAPLQNPPSLETWRKRERREKKWRRDWGRKSNWSTYYNFNINKSTWPSWHYTTLFKLVNAFY